MSQSKENLWTKRKDRQTLFYRTLPAEAGAPIKDEAYLVNLFTNLEIQKYYQNETSIHGVYSCDNLPDQIKDRAYLIYLDEYADVGTHWIALYLNGNAITYFDSFGVENVPKEIKNSIDESAITTNIFRIQAYDSIICRHF